MSILSDKDRRKLQRLLDRLEELEAYKKGKEQWRLEVKDAVQLVIDKVNDLLQGFKDLFKNMPPMPSSNPDSGKGTNGTSNKKQVDLDSVTDAKKVIQETLKNNYSEDDALANFELFGKVGNEQERQKYIDALKDHLNNPTEADVVRFPESEDFKQISAATQAILNHPDLIQLSQENPEISKEIAQEIVDWAKEVSKDLKRNHPFEVEEKLFQEVTTDPLKKFQKRFPSLKKNLQEIYDKETLNLPFYDKKRKELNRAIKAATDEEQQADLQEEVDALKSAFLEDWEKQLTEKRLLYELQVIDEAREKFTEDLYKRIEEYNELKDLLEPFTDDVGRLWDMSQGVWKKTGFDILKKYAALLKKDKSLAELAELLGRFRQVENEYEEEQYEETSIQEEWKIQYAQKSELIGIKESNDLSSLLPSETANLADRDTESIFLKKYAEKKLVTFDYQAHSKTAQEISEMGTRQKAKAVDQGPIIICVDTSGSMQGAPEQIAKVLCFALLKIALKDNRKCYLISFSTKIQTLELTNLQDSLDALVQFLSRSFHGGTDATPAIKEALRMLYMDDYEKADVLLISDFVMPAFDAAIEEDLQKSKEKETQFHSLTISTTGNKNVFNSFDNNWIYNPRNKEGMIELVKQIREMRRVDKE